mmetsp:Transcript_4864/g.6799  ORF Transcript_4864/g.6799 Transcript_4864/m.6799 type:complete len:144 (-) Transcript_4864:442-873(-)
MPEHRLFRADMWNVEFYHTIFSPTSKLHSSQQVQHHFQYLSTCTIFSISPAASLPNSLYSTTHKISNQPEISSPLSITKSKKPFSKLSIIPPTGQQSHQTSCQPFQRPLNYPYNLISSQHSMPITKAYVIVRFKVIKQSEIPT